METREQECQEHTPGGEPVRAGGDSPRRAAWRAGLALPVLAWVTWLSAGGMARAQG